MSNLYLLLSMNKLQKFSLIRTDLLKFIIVGWYSRTKKERPFEEWGGFSQVTV